MGIVWETHLSYPSDRIGRYQEFEGKIVHTDAPRGSGVYYVAVLVEGVGRLLGYWEIPDSHRDDSSWAPPVGGTARIRVYDSGGAWYPDNRIMGFSGRPAGSSATSGGG